MFLKSNFKIVRYGAGDQRLGCIFEKRTSAFVDPWVFLKVSLYI